jgi:transaldolase
MSFFLLILIFFFVSVWVIHHRKRHAVSRMTALQKNIVKKRQETIMGNNLMAMNEMGQSPWYDNIDRNIIQNGDLKKLFALGVTGVTSNPSIFEKAITGSTVYDDDIRRLAREGKTVDQIYDIVTIHDVQCTADLLLDVYRKTNKKDGYVSLEVNPEYAHDAAKTIANARALHKEVARPNLMIKVPGTKEGPEAIRVLTKEGINVNVTLLFSLRHYEASALAYIQGLKDRLREGLSLNNVCSVASVFISRVDSAVDKLLDERNACSLKGKTAVANAKMIYQRFKALFEAESFAALSSQGARIQRVLWGSTSTKNPDYSDVKYVEELVGKHTVNTLPHSTLEAVLDHGSIRSDLEKDLQQEKENLNKLSQLGIDLDGICNEVQDQGVEAFATSFRKLMDAISRKMSD